MTRMWSTIKDEFPKTLLGIVVSGLGFLLALFLNQWIGRIGEKDTYDGMLRAIKSELAFNKQIYETSYTQYLLKGLILREYSYSAVGQTMTNPLFRKYSSDDDGEILNAYVRDLLMANSFRRVAENTYFNPPPTDPTLMNRVRIEWCAMLAHLPKDFSRVAGLKSQGSDSATQGPVAEEPALPACRK
jgi:hypothetical protein